MLHEHDNLDEDESEEEPMAAETTEQEAVAEEACNIMEDASDDSLNFNLSPPCTPRCVDELGGRVDWSRR